MLEDVRIRQLPYIPTDATHVVISATGNDLLKLMNEMVVANFSLRSLYSTICLSLATLADKYAALVRQLKTAGFHVCVCTIQHPNFNHFVFKSIAGFGLGIHNSRIKRISEEEKCSVIDIANILDCIEDFANPLEMSTRGGSKVVGNIEAFVKDHPVPVLMRRNTLENSDSDVIDVFGMYQSRICCSGRADQQSKIYSGKDICFSAEQQPASSQSRRHCDKDPTSSSSTMIYSPSRNPSTDAPKTTELTKPSADIPEASAELMCDV